MALLVTHEATRGGFVILPRLSVLRVLCAAGLLLALSAPAAPMAGAQATDDPRFFSQTNFRIDNDAFWDFFQHRGGVRTFGYPVSRTFRLDGFPVQIYQRVVMQLWPDGGVHTLNLLDQGLLPYTRINGSTFPAPDPGLISSAPTPTDPEYATKIIQFIHEQAPDTFEGEPVNFSQTFDTTVTEQDAPDAGPGLLPLFDLDIWGAPTSKPQRDPSNNNFIYQRFQRSIMHYDKTCGCTQGLLLADYLKAVITGQNLPPDLESQVQSSKYYKQYAPGKPGSLARPNDLPNSDLTNAFDPQQAGAPAAQPAPGTNTGGAPATPSGSFGYGFQVHLWDLNQQAKGLVVGNVKQAGFNWSKNQWNWSAIEKAPGQYDWSEPDRIVDAEASAGLNILISVQDSPAFYRSPSSGLMPSDPSKFGQLMQAMAARYKGRVKAYELWNEPNLAREAGPNIDPSTYLPLLKAGHDGVKAGDSSAVTFIGALSPTGNSTPGVSMDDLAYLQALYALNGGEARNYFDVMAAHLSGFSNPPDCTPSTPQCSLSGGWNNDPSFFAFYRLGQYRDAMVAAGDGDKKIWLTEFGYDSNPVAIPGYEYSTYISEDTQARFLVQAFDIARKTPYIGGVMVWNLNYQLAVPQTDEKWGFAVMRSDWSPRPAYSALATMPKS
jgi:polysaccharide biosynthesis protein PslG